MGGWRRRSSTRCRSVGALGLRTCARLEDRFLLASLSFEHTTGGRSQTSRALSRPRGRQVGASSWQRCGSSSGRPPSVVSLLPLSPDSWSNTYDRGMALTGEYEPSRAAWVRDQVAEYEASGGARANTLRDTGLPVVIVTMQGERTGKIRKIALMRVEHGGEYAFVASKGGAPARPPGTTTCGPTPARCRSRTARSLSTSRCARWKTPSAPPGGSGRWTLTPTMRHTRSALTARSRCWGQRPSGRQCVKITCSAWSLTVCLPPRWQCSTAISLRQDRTHRRAWADRADGPGDSCSGSLTGSPEKGAEMVRRPRLTRHATRSPWWSVRANSQAPGVVAASRRTHGCTRSKIPAAVTHQGSYATVTGVFRAAELPCRRALDAPMPGEDESRELSYSSPGAGCWPGTAPPARRLPSPGA